MLWIAMKVSICPYRFVRELGLMVAAMIDVGKIVLFSDLVNLDILDLKGRRRDIGVSLNLISMLLIGIIDWDVDNPRVNWHVEKMWMLLLFVVVINDWA